MSRHIQQYSADMPVLLTNLSMLIECALEHLHDVERQGMDAGSLSDLDRGIALLTIGADVASFTVDAYEQAAHDRLQQMSAAVKGDTK